MTSGRVVVMRASATPRSSSSGSGWSACRQVDLVGEELGAGSGGATLARGRRVDARRARECGGATTDDVHLQVVRVAVPAAFVVDGEHVGALLAQDLGEMSCGFFHVGGGERVVSIVGGPTSAMPESWYGRNPDAV